MGSGWSYIRDFWRFYLVKLVEFVLNNNSFEFKNEIKQHFSGTVIDAKVPPPCACI